jgi:outer membrane protein assembly factor BamB
MNTPSLLFTSLAFVATLKSSLADWGQYRGPNGDGSTAEKISAKWSASGPKQVWKGEAEAGFSSISVSGGVAASLVTRDVEGVQTEVCVAWDAKTGKELWASPLKNVKYQGGGDAGTKENKGGDGPRSTPSIVNGKVIAYGGNLDLLCFDAKSGKTLWSHSIGEDFGGKNISWQNATSPLVHGNLVVVIGGGAGQAMLAFDLASGKNVWKTGDDTMTHATPIAATIHGEAQIIFFGKSGLTSLAPADGKQLWHQDYKFNVSTAASPVVWQDIVYCSAGYGVGAGAYKITKNGSSYSSEEIWRTEGKNMNHWSTPVVKDGFLYGMFSFKEYGNGPVACVDIRTGEEKWREAGFGPGNVVLAGQDLLALSDKGELVVIEANSSGYKERSRGDVLDGKCWSTPTLADGHVYARSTKEAGCWAVK